MRRAILAGCVAAAIPLLAACGSDSTDSATVEAAAPDAPDAPDVPDVPADDAEVPGVRVVDLDTAEQLLADGDRVLIDVRTPAEYDEVRLAGARLIDLSSPTFAEEIAALDRELSYVIYCRTANRSASARALMDELGFTDVADIAGGIVAWSAAGLPVEG